jgi:hypothetical protein
MPGLLPIEKHIAQRKIIVIKDAKNRPIFQKCLTSRPISRNANQLVWLTNQEMMPRHPLEQGIAMLSSILEINNT